MSSEGLAGQVSTDARERLEAVRIRSGHRRAAGMFLRNRMAAVGALFILVIAVVAIAAPVVAGHDPNDQDLFARLDGPSAQHWFGTDELGRDVFARVAYGARYSLMIGIAGSIGGLIVGLSLGLISGYFEGWTDNVIMRLIDIMLSFPGVLLAILIVSVLGPGLNNLIIALTFWFTPTIARIIRGNVLALKQQEFIEAARAAGATNLRIMTRHLVPNTTSPLIVYGTLSVATALLVAAGLSFLGLGVQPPTPEWGAMIGSGRQFMRDQPFGTIAPGLAIFFTVLSLNFIGDALRDALDPRLTGWTPGQ